MVEEELVNPNNSKDQQDLEAQELTSFVFSQQSGDHTKPTATNDGLSYVEGQEQTTSRTIEKCEDGP